MLITKVTPGDGCRCTRCNLARVDAMTAEWCRELARRPTPSINGQFFDPYDYGAVGDGVADDTRAVRDAFDVAALRDVTPFERD